MANWYIRSLAGGTASGADWANAKLTLAAAFTAGAAGDSFWVSEDHAETGTAANTLTAPGTAANPCFIYCVNHSGSVPPVSADLRTTATITTTTTGTITIQQNSYYYGITFSAGSGASNASITIGTGNDGFLSFNSCALVLGGTGGSSRINLAGTSAGSEIRFNNVPVTFNSINQFITINSGRFFWSNTASAIVGATIPTKLFGAGTFDDGGKIVITGVDLSALGSGKTIVGASTQPFDVILQDCKLGASVTLAAASSIVNSANVYVIRCDSSGTNYRTEKYMYPGSQSTETTIVRTGAASDGTTPISQKIVTTANSKWVLPFDAIPITIWNDSTSAITTLTIYGTTTGGGVPKDDEIWIDVEYLGSSLTPQGSFITSSKADNLAASAATNNSADGSTWGGGGAGNGFKIVCPSFTPGQAGPINIYLRAAKASSTYYIDPKPSI